MPLTIHFSRFLIVNLQDATQIICLKGLHKKPHHGMIKTAITSICLFARFSFALINKSQSFCILYMALTRRLSHAVNYQPFTLQNPEITTGKTFKNASLTSHLYSFPKEIYGLCPQLFVALQLLKRVGLCFCSFGDNSMLRFIPSGLE